MINFSVLHPNYIWYWSIIWLELDDILVGNGQLYSLTYKFCLVLVNFFIRITYFFILNVQNFSLMYKYCLGIINFLTRIGILFLKNVHYFNFTSKFCLLLVDFLSLIEWFLPEMNIFSDQHPNLIWNWLLFWLELAYYFNGNVQFFKLMSNLVAICSIFWIDIFLLIEIINFSV